VTLERLRASLADRYTIEHELGRGGMATVYLAQDLKHDRKVAIKVLRPELAAAIGPERFLAEIRTTANLQHPHILPLFDSGQAGTFLFYVMPFVRGESLRERLARDKQLPIADAIRITAEVAAALDYAHRQGVIHRDIKPENILLYDGSALVADFGIALAASRAGGARLTETGISLGTPEYMSPEQATGEREITPRSDVYSLGCVMYEMLLGEPPFTGPSGQSIIAKVLTEKPAPLVGRRDTIPPAVEHAVLTALQKLPADRFASARALSAALTSELPGHPATRPASAERSLTHGAFRLSEDVCRRLPRASFDPRLIGTHMTYLDNEVPSEVLVCYIAACGWSAEQFSGVLRRVRHRAVAPTFRGFEQVAAWRPALSVEDHLILVREFLRDLVTRLRPRRTIIAGFSSGADCAMRLAGAPDPESRLHLDGCLALGANLSSDTCFLTGVLAKMESGDDADMLRALRRVSEAMASLDDWVAVCEYAIHIVPTFRKDSGPLRTFAIGIASQFEQESVTRFATWYRAAAARGCRLRCVFEDTSMYRDLVRELQLRTLDEDLLGERYEEDSIVTVADTTHFDLIDPERVEDHAEALIKRLETVTPTSGRSEPVG
jgi:tRNA A-37 threonylcarbamoyl transferase component Bud32